MIYEIGLSAYKVVRTPMEVNVNFTSKLYDKHFRKHQHDLLYIYRKIIGKLLYFIITRPDIAFFIEHLSQYIQEPKT